MGIPSVTTVYNGAAEILAVSGAGIVVSSPKDTKAIVAAMEELADPRRRAARREACLAVADRLGVERHVDELMNVYAEITARP